MTSHVGATHRRAPAGSTPGTHTATAMFAMSHARVGGLATAAASARRGVVGARAALVPAGRVSGAVSRSRVFPARRARPPRVRGVRGVCRRGGRRALSEVLQRHGG